MFHRIGLRRVDYLLDPIRAGEVVLPADDGRLDPFVDADDIADAAGAALTEPGHAGQVDELTSPRLLSCPEVVAEIAEASARAIDIREGRETRRAAVKDLIRPAVAANSTARAASPSQKK